MFKKNPQNSLPSSIEDRSSRRYKYHIETKEKILLDKKLSSFEHTTFVLFIEYVLNTI
jgi:hypothetical protein